MSANVNNNRKTILEDYECLDCGHKRVWSSMTNMPMTCSRCKGQGIRRKR